MTFSELLERVGSMGRFQVVNVLLLGVPILGLANHSLLQIFTATTPAHHCRPPPNASAGPWLLPTGLDGKSERCLRFVQPPNASLPNDTQAATEPCLDGWVYNGTRDTIVTEWDLVCQSSQQKHLAQSVYMAGILIGGIVLGDLSDRFGRKPILTLSYLLMAASGSVTAFSPGLPVYMAFRFLTGCCVSGIVMSTVILSMEWVPTRVRPILSLVLGYCYTIGQFILLGLAYIILQWRWLQLTVSAPFIVFFLWSWWLTESIRWMVLSGKTSKALQVLRRVAAINGKKEEGEKLSLEELSLNLQKEISSAKVKYSIADLFRTPVLRRVTFCLSLSWFTTGFAYYSVAMAVEEFGANIYLLQIIFGGIDLPAKFIIILSISHLGRRTSEVAALFLAGGTILALTFVPSDMQILRTVLAVVGKGCLASSFNCLFLYTSELYPTVIRQTGLGLSNLWTRVGSMVSPLVMILGEVQPFVPNLIFGTTTLMGAGATLFLPETIHQPLPETIEDAESRSQWTRQAEQETEAEKATQRIPLQPRGPGLRPS
ncbi:organic anion transporter 3 [Dasypus novemcinctus]|uniref:organic anion transporter 3 n=1 Tax=Dasypus novemcinctus TaxID=9361 RepID=UPI0003CBF9AB|nr:organic anion transporter 3 [Dasypus novemcinctus]